MSIMGALWITLPLIAATIRDSLYNADIMTWDQAIDWTNLWIPAWIILIVLLFIVANKKTID